uniref:Uncharacterized protein n=1 Tax=Plectus sambesii TaxID=2011161 RepID=A0A914UTA5_9BILA
MECSCCCAAVYVTIAIAIYFIVQHYLKKLVVPNWDKRHVFVTGCDSGFGHLLALQLAAHKFHVYAGCFTHKGAEELKKKAQSSGIGSKLETIPLDVTSQESVDRAFDVVEKKLGHFGLWGLVNNAGSLGVNGPDDWLTVADYQSVMDINAMGVIRVSQKFKPLVKKAKGRLVTVASVLGRVALKSAGPYCMSKYACEAYMDVLRQEMRHFGVSVHILEPGTFRQTGLLEREMMDRMQENVWKRTSESTKLEYGATFFQKWKEAQDKLVKLLDNGDPQKVADAYFHALTARYPKRRYVIGIDSMLLWIPMSMLPTCIQDWLWALLEKLHGSLVPDAVK